MVLSTSSITSYTSLVTHIIGSSIKHTNNTNIAPGHHTTLSSTTPAWWSSSTQGQSTRAVPIIHHMYRCTCYSFRHPTITRNIRYTAVNNMWWINDFTYSVRMYEHSPNRRLSWWCSGDVVATAQAINSPLHGLCHLRDGHLAHWSPPPKLEQNMLKRNTWNWTEIQRNMLLPSAKYHEMWMPAPQPRTSCTRSAIHGKHQKFRVQINKRVINNRVSYVYDEQQ